MKKLLTIKLLGLIAVSSLHAQQEISFNDQEMVIGTKSSAVIQPAANQPVLYINDHEKNFIKATEEEHKKISYCNRYGEYETNPIIIAAIAQRILAQKRLAKEMPNIIQKNIADNNALLNSQTISRVGGGVTKPSFHNVPRFNYGSSNATGHNYTQVPNPTSTSTSFNAPRYNGGPINWLMPNPDIIPFYAQIEGNPNGTNCDFSQSATQQLQEKRLGLFCKYCNKGPYSISCTLTRHENVCGIPLDCHVPGCIYSVKENSSYLVTHLQDRHGFSYTDAFNTVDLKIKKGQEAREQKRQ